MLLLMLLLVVVVVLVLVLVLLMLLLLLLFCFVGCDFTGSDPAERLKLVMAFAVGGMRQQCSCDKPFNPILVRHLSET